MSILPSYHVLLSYLLLSVITNWSYNLMLQKYELAITISNNCSSFFCQKVSAVIAVVINHCVL